MKNKVICGVGLSALILAGCGTTPTQRAATGGLAGAAVGGAVGGNWTGALVGGAAGAALGAATAPNRSHSNDRRQYWDSRAGRYYYQDRSTGRYYWENGDPRY